MSDDRIKVIAAIPIPEGRLVRTPEGAVRAEKDSVMVTAQTGEKYVVSKKGLTAKYHLLAPPDRKPIVVEPIPEEPKPMTINEKNDYNKKKKRPSGIFSGIFSKGEKKS